MDWVHLHLALNHLPVVGIPFALLVVFWGWMRASREILIVGLWLVTATAGAGIAIKFSGDEAAAILNRPNDPFIQRHEESADQATTAMFVLLLVSGAALVSARRGRPFRKWLVIGVLLAGLATCVMLARTANIGGQITHPEIR